MYQLMLLTVAIAVTVATSQETTSKIGSWELSQSTDPFADTTNCRLMALASDGAGALGVRLQAGELLVMVVGTKSFDYHYQTSQVEVRYRVNDDDPVTETWVAAENRKVVVSALPKTLAARLATATKFAFQAQAIGGNVATLVFELDQSAEAFEAFEACKTGS